MPRPDDVHVPIKALRAPPAAGGLVQVYVDHWWIVDPDDRVIFYRGSTPQCNSQPALVDRLCDKLWPGCTVEQIVDMFVPMRMVTTTRDGESWTDLEPALDGLT